MSSDWSVQHLQKTWTYCKKSPKLCILELEISIVLFHHASPALCTNGGADLLCARITHLLLDDHHFIPQIDWTFTSYARTPQPFRSRQTIRICHCGRFRILRYRMYHLLYCTPSLRVLLQLVHCHTISLVSCCDLDVGYVSIALMFWFHSLQTTDIVTVSGGGFYLLGQWLLLYTFVLRLDVTFRDIPFIRFNRNVITMCYMVITLLMPLMIGIFITIGFQQRMNAIIIAAVWSGIVFVASMAMMVLFMVKV